MRYVIAIDEGTTSTRAVLYDLDKNAIVRQKSSPIKQFYPKPSFVEENASEIYAETLSSLVEMIESVDSASQILGIGITNQRETVIAWDKKTGKPLYNAIVWQCRRTTEYMKELSATYGKTITEKTGLVMDAYFSASKIKWLIDNVAEIREKAKKGEVCFGTVDSYLVYKLTGGEFVTDITNASRTMLFNIHTCDYDDELLALFGVPRACLPKIVDSDAKVGYFTYGGAKIAVCGIAGDQQAALIGQACLSEGMSKITYGTGLFLLYNIGYKPIISQKGLITTVGYRINGRTSYAFEGSVFNAGSAVQWLRDGLGIIRSSSEIEALARTVEDNGGVYFVPAFTGLGAPYWNGDSRGVICGLTRGATKAHLARATLEAMAYSAKDLVDVMVEESKIKLGGLRCDGGASANDLLMDFQAGVLGVDIDRPKEKESTALGAAFLCGIGLGLIEGKDLYSLRRSEKVFTPGSDAEKYRNYYNEWKKAIGRALYE